MKSTLGFEEAAATPRQRRAALSLCTALVAVASLAAIFGRGPGPEVKPFLLLTGTIWSLADLLTAFLLLAQFYVNGRLLFAILGVAYAFSSFMTWPYIVAFPGVFRTGALTLGEEQISSYAWAISHCAFPVLVAGAALNDSKFGRISSRRSIGLVASLAVAAPVIVAGAISALLFTYHEALPIVINHGLFQHLYKIAVLPSVVLLNVLACVVLLARRRTLTPLVLWVAVVTFSAALDSLMVTLSSARYSYAWDVGKLITVATANIVLVMILSDIAGLYNRLEQAARIDFLTGLKNRRAFEEHCALVFHNARRLRKSIGLLVIDIDLFKAYNDSHGHLAGDECLRRVAQAMADSATRPLDLVARYGGEEFVVVLPDTPLQGVLIVAERIRSVISTVQCAAPQGAVTVSIGVGFAADALSVDEETLFEAADRALYEAKKSGRNAVVLGNLEATRALKEVHVPFAMVASATAKET